MRVADKGDRKQEERRRHIEELKERLELIAGGPVPAGSSENCPDEVYEKFLENVLAFETAPQMTLFDALVKKGVQLPAPEQMDDPRLTATLWEVIRGMALFGAYLHSTDHLSDRELYHRLWAEILHEPTVLMPENPCFTQHIDIIGAFSEEDIQLYLKYYADEEARQRWVEQFPADIMPVHEAPPYDRDRHLPGCDGW
jgi:hypothetical protein